MSQGDILRKKNQTIYSAILSSIREYNKIAIFRHIHPDFDALGSAFALKEFINHNFLNKEVKVLGDNHDDFTPRLYPKSDKTPNSWFDDSFLAIILDTPNNRRVADPRFKKASLIIKIDHHPFIEKIGDIELIEPSLSSTAELILNILISFDMSINKVCAKYIYTGIVGDSGRFEYNNTSALTFESAEYLSKIGLDLTDIYRNMYLHDQNDLKVIAHILTHYNLSKKGVGYYVLTRDDLENFKITTNQGKDHVNLFHFVEGIKIWCAITEDLKEKCFRVSLRSEKIDVSGVASKYRGGGHMNASGAKLLSLNELDDFIADLDKLIK